MELKKFEAALRSMATKRGYAESTANIDKEQERRRNAFDESYRIFERILGDIFDKNSEVDQDIAIEKVKGKIRSVLGIEELTKKRSESGSFYKPQVK
ncbi:MAG TPA: hypothetical protein ENN66_01730 [Proteobacteria bacterium]|nr:hypothetical protein [Pseudomonadota bacterium]